MKPFDKSLYTTYSIGGDGWMVNFNTYESAYREWRQIAVRANFYGNKPDGKQDILDSWPN